MADSTYEIIHQHYATGAAAIAAMNDQNWAYEEAAKRIIVMDGATARYYYDSAYTDSGFIRIQTASAQSGGAWIAGAFTANGNGAFGGTLTVTGASTLAALSATSATISGLSSGRVVTTSTAGLLAQDNLYWDATNDRLGIGSGASSPTVTIDIIKTATGSDVTSRVYNTETANSSSNAKYIVQTDGSSSGDPYIWYRIYGQTDWSTGPDNSDNDAFVISEASTLGTSNRLRIARGGAVTIPGTIGVTGAATFSSSITQSAGALTVSVDDNTANAVDIQQGTNNYFNVNTTNAAENISFGNATTNPSYSFLGLGAASFGGAVNLSTANGEIRNSSGDEGAIAITASPTSLYGAFAKWYGHEHGSYPGLTEFGFESAVYFSVRPYSGGGGVRVHKAIELYTSVSVGAGGTNWTDEVNINVSGKSAVELTPTADNQTYKITDPTTGQLIFVTNMHASYAVLVDLESGAGTNTQYITAGKSCCMRYNGTRWYSTY